MPSRSYLPQYTVTPDYQFLVDRLPGSDSVRKLLLLALGMVSSTSAAVGEAVAELMMSGVTIMIWANLAGVFHTEIGNWQQDVV
ncbi:MAG: hypothetical protein H6992_07115 [Pseudomonadales bacterium]|nr:hypothetical protein [Pseudomonadales bacterium]